ncbi:F-box domain-containing protein [Mycena venus]|uniref:F-box domain-containing protein n=1 Tax=Mycena venus TaxID=2733690 RepID=A0A8H6YG93_9AGAR|nr:F-box domain-containing protein [Mycena venus]
MAQICLTCGAPQATLASILQEADALGATVASSSPRLTSLLTSNTAPLESEILFIRRIVSDGQAQVNALDAQIGVLEALVPQLQAALAQLVRRRDEAAMNVRRHQSVISPIRLMPPELICEIFTLTVESRTGFFYPPWQLGQISQSWRHLALSYPSLWSYITITTTYVSSYLPYTVSPSKFTRLLLQIETQLLRSANAPLDIDWSNANSDMEPRLLELLFPHCSRWRSLRLRGPGSLMFQPFSLHWLRPLDGRLSKLEKLHVMDFYIVYMPDIFPTVPNLRSVLLSDSLSHSAFRDHSPYISIPWRQVTQYRGTYTPDQQLRILTAAKNVAVCSLAFRSFDAYDLSTHPVAVLPRLRRLYIGKEADLSAISRRPSWKTSLRRILRPRPSHYSISGSRVPRVPRAH